MKKCPICDKEYENGRQLHGHMLKSHREEYRKAGHRVANMTGGGGDDAVHRPAGFRLLDKSDPMEQKAYSEGYRFADNEYFYTAEEAKGKGWI